MKWVDKVKQMRSEQYSKKDTLEYIKRNFRKKKIEFSPKHQSLFEQAWRDKQRIIPTVEDVVDEVALPVDLTKMKDFQQRQVVNFLKHLDRPEIERRWKLVNIGINVYAAKNKKRDLENFKILSNLLYETKMIKVAKLDREESKCQDQPILELPE